MALCLAVLLHVCTCTVAVFFHSLSFSLSLILLSQMIYQYGVGWVVCYSGNICIVMVYLEANNYTLLHYMISVCWCVKWHCGEVVEVIDCGPKIPGLNPTCCSTGEGFSLPSIPFGDQPLVLKRRRGSFALEIVACCPQQLNLMHALPKQNSFSFI